MYDWTGWMPHGGMGYGMGWILMVLFWVLVIAGIATLVKWVMSSSQSNAAPPQPQGRSALDSLKERYARGGNR